MTTNRLQAFLDKASAEPAVVTPEVSQPKRRVVSEAKPTVLIGAHLPPAYHKQLRLIAAEEGCQVNNLIREALDLLFVKKGKARIAD